MQTENWRRLLRLYPQPSAWSFCWDSFSDTPLRPYLEQMAHTFQNPDWHGEGDVLTHTRMVCEALSADQDFRDLDRERRDILFTAALLHDVGKIPCTKLVQGVWTSPEHTVVGANLAGKILADDFGLRDENASALECVVFLIRYHSVPVHLYQQKYPEKRMRAMAAEGERVPYFSLRLLHILIRADLRGRICAKAEEELERVDRCFVMAEQYV